MLTRRHIRIKVMQCIYALTLSKDDSLEKQEKFLRYSIDSMYNLYLLMLSLMIEIRKKASDQLQLSSKKYLATASDKFPGGHIREKLRMLDDVIVQNLYVLIVVLPVF